MGKGTERSEYYCVFVVVWNIVYNLRVYSCEGSGDDLVFGAGRENWKELLENIWFSV